MFGFQTNQGDIMAATDKLARYNGTKLARTAARRGIKVAEFTTGMRHIMPPDIVRGIFENQTVRERRMDFRKWLASVCGPRYVPSEWAKSLIECYRKRLLATRTGSPARVLCLSRINALMAGNVNSDAGNDFPVVSS